MPTLQKNILQDAKTENKLIGDNPALLRTEHEGNHKEQKGNQGRSDRKEQVLPGAGGSVPLAHHPRPLCPSCLGAPFGLGR